MPRPCGQDRIPIVNIRVANQCDSVKPGALHLGRPVEPHSYSRGFSRDGRILGSNTAVPYPRELPLYHHIPFRRMVDWYVPNTLGPHDHETWDVVCSRGKSRHDCDQCEIKTSIRGLKLDTEFEADVYDKKCEEPVKVLEDDARYIAWRESKAEAQRARDAAQERVRKVPPELKMIPGHSAPPVLETTSQAYGQHLDLLPPPPRVYPDPGEPPKPLPVLVRFRRSNMSDHPPIPDHSFAVPQSEQVTPEGKPLRGMMGAPFVPDKGGNLNKVKVKWQRLGGERGVPTKTEGGVTVVSGEGVKPPAPGMDAYDPWTFRRSAVVLGRVVGERLPKSTWPMFSSTGLELNRPVPRTVIMAVGDPLSDKGPARVDVPIDSRDGVYDTDFGDFAVKPRKKDCVPKEPGFIGFSQRQPCHRDFFNPELLPVPGGWRDDLPCDPSSKPLPCDVARGQ